MRKEWKFSFFSFLFKFINKVGLWGVDLAENIGIVIAGGNVFFE